MIKRKLNFIIISLLMLISYSCSNNSSKNIASKNIMQFALYSEMLDAYPKGLFQYFKDHSIKTVSFISTNYETNKIDSLTYLEINNDGKLIARTTKECTTIGCYRNMNRQEYIYSNNKIKRIDVYMFKNNEQPVLSEWLNPYKPEFYKVDSNIYSYQGDTIFVETGILLFKYLTDSNDNIIFRSWHVKYNDQIISSNINYSDSTIVEKTKDNFSDKTYTEHFKIKGNHIELWLINNKIPKLVKEWIFDSAGLINEIYTYRNRKIFSKTKLSYNFYD